MSARDADKSELRRVRRQKFVRRMKSLKLRKVLTARRGTPVAIPALPLTLYGIGTSLFVRS